MQAGMTHAREHAACMVSVTAPVLRGSGGPTRPYRRRWFNTHHRGFGLLAGKPASLSRGGEHYNHLLLKSRPASPLRAYAILNYTLGVGQTRLRGVGFTAIHFCH